VIARRLSRRGILTLPLVLLALPACALVLPAASAGAVRSPPPNCELPRWRRAG
jgi:hypothetical protein